ncbi:MAG: hypothetical protein LW720_07795 [Pirellula sp.]|jgi:hypothetical protein|nr:hypothetical protein [Pirellula sp.]
MGTNGLWEMQGFETQRHRGHGEEKKEEEKHRGTEDTERRRKKKRNTEAQRAQRGGRKSWRGRWDRAESR